jgi:hypothetical protein
MWACRNGFNVCGFCKFGLGMILMCGLCRFGLGCNGQDRIGVHPPPPFFSQIHLLFCFCNFFHFASLCPNIEQPRLPIGRLQNENDHHVSYISIYLIATQSFIRNNVLLTHLSYVALDDHLILSA